MALIVRPDTKENAKWCGQEVMDIRYVCIIRSRPSGDITVSAGNLSRTELDVHLWDSAPQVIYTRVERPVKLMIGDPFPGRDLKRSLQPDHDGD
ncbi:hypothetical protein BM1_05365 [Bipolaris maydis]|nr:hypothetical protein BM1_05365 [Bipolaris maydis]